MVDPYVSTICNVTLNDNFVVFLCNFTIQNFHVNSSLANRTSQTDLIIRVQLKINLIMKYFWEPGDEVQINHVLNMSWKKIIQS